MYRVQVLEAYNRGVAPSRETPGTEVFLEDGVVVVVEHGAVDMARSEDVLGQAVRMAMEAGTLHLVFDLTDARIPDYHAIAVAHGDQAADTGIARFRIALVGRPGDPMLTFFETVGINRGVTTRSFATRDEAKRWLKG